MNRNCGLYLPWPQPQRENGHSLSQPSKRSKEKSLNPAWPLPLVMLVGAWELLISDEDNVHEQLRKGQTKRRVFVLYGT